MNRDVQARWVAALRSGEYPQATGCLRNDVGFCCYGVLTDLAVKAGVGEWGTDFDPSLGLLPRLVVDWAGLVDADPYLAGFDADPYLAVPASVWNDAGLPFTAIADAIEAQL